MTHRRAWRTLRVRHAAAVSLVATAGLVGTYLGSPRIPQAYARQGAPFEAMFTGSGRPGPDSVLPIQPGARLRTLGSDWVRPADLPFGLTCDFSVDDSVSLHSAIQSSLDDSVICITKDILDLREQVVIDDTSLTIIGASGDDSTTGVTLTAVDTRHIYATFDDTQADLTLINITFEGGSTDDSGGSIFIDGARDALQGTGLFMIDDTFIGNTAGGSGGAIYAKDMSTVVDGGEDSAFAYLGSVFEGNRTGGDGGAIYAQNVVDVVFYGTTLTRNYASGSGGAVAVRSQDSGTLVGGVGATFTDDSAGVAGGAIAVEGTDQVTFVYFVGIYGGANVFTGNSAPTGGGVWLSETGSGSAAFRALGDVRMTDNTATSGDGGAVLVANDDSTAGPPSPGPFGDQARFLVAGDPRDGTGRPIFTGNYAKGDGGAAHVIGLADAGGLIVSNALTPDFSGSTFTGNVAGGSGGALYVDGTLVTRQSSFVGNTANAASLGGGAIAVDDSTPGSTSFPYRGAFVRGSYFAGNYAPNGSGGAIYVPDGAGEILAQYSTFARNSAYGYGGALFGDDTVSVINSTLTGNQSGVGAGAIGGYGYVLADFSTITDNSTIGVGGGIYAATVTITNSIVQRNRASGYVGGARIANPNPQDVLSYGSVDDSFSLFTSAGDVFARGTSWSRGPGTLFSAGPVVGSLGDNGGFPVSDDTVIPTMLPLARSPVIDAANPSASGFPTTDQRGPGFPRVIGPRANIGAVEVAAAPDPPAPTPASPPRDVTAQAGDAEITVTWQAPASSGSFPVTNYRAIATAEGQGAAQPGTCLVVASALSCTITGLANGTTYTVRAQALTGAGWSALSQPSEPVTPEAPVRRTIVISGTRERIEGRSTVVVNGETTGLVDDTVKARVRLAGQPSYVDGSTRVVDEVGTFMWQRVTKKKVYVYFVAEDGLVRSNRVIIRR